MAEAEKVIAAAAHEPSDITGRFVLAAVAVVLTALACITMGVLLAFPSALRDKTMRYPVPNFPQPTLQPSPRADMTRFYAAEMQVLNGTGWVDRAHGIAHIPIDDGMRLLARDGIPGWPGPK